MGNVKEKLMFAAEVCIVIAAVYFFQTSVMQIPLLGPALPGGKPASGTTGA